MRNRMHSPVIKMLVIRLTTYYEYAEIPKVERTNVDEDMCPRFLLTVKFNEVSNSR
jgi:hypothetical protein